MPKQVNPTVSEQISPDGIPLAAAAPEQPPIAPQEKQAESVVPLKEESTKEEPTGDEAPKEGDDKTIDFSEFLAIKETPEIKKEPKKEEPKKEISKEESVLKDEKTKDTIIDKSDDNRDYTDFSEEEKILFRGMSNKAFNNLKPVYLEHRRLKAEREELNKQLEEAKKGITKIPENYYEHPQAFVLTPEFATASQKVENSQIVFDHWANQLNKMREGAKEIDLLGNDQSGNLIIAGKAPADITMETKLLTYINFAQNQLMNAQSERQALAKTHAEKHQNANAFIKDFEKQSFPVFEDSEQKKRFEPLISDTLNKLPQAFRNNPLSTILAKSLVTNLQLAMLVKQMQGNGSATPTKSAAAKVGPSAAEAAGEGDGGKAGKDNVTIDDFERVKQGV